MALKALDTADITTGHAHELAALGYEAVGVYLRSDRAPLAMIQGLCSVGIKIFSIWEKGNPTVDGYFTEAQAEIDVAEAVAYAQKIGQPAGTVIFFAIDEDASIETVEEYVLTIHAKTRETSPYYAGLYGDGNVLDHFKEAGYSHASYLSQSTGWDGYSEDKPNAAIIQGESTTVLGFDVDLDTVVDESVLWTLSA